MRTRSILLITLILLLPLSAGAVYFPAGIDWTHPSQQRFVQSLYLNILGRAPATTESQRAVQTLRRNDNRTSRLRIFEDLVQSPEYQRAFNNTDKSWSIFQAPDYNYNNGEGYYRYQAAQSQPQGFTTLANGNRSFSESIARSVAHYYNAFCYRGEPCINNPELARDRDTNVLPQASINNAHACANQANLNSQFKWVAVNGTTYPRGIGRDTICLDDGYYQASQLSLQRFDCSTGYTDCQRNRSLDLRASRSGQDNDGHASLFFRDGSRLALIQTDPNQTTEHTGVTPQPQTNTDPLLADNAHACADPGQTNSRFTWQSATRNAEVKGVGTNIICMDSYYYVVRGMTLYRNNCSTGYTNCQPDQRNNLTAERRTSVGGKPGFIFTNGTSVLLSARDLPTQSTRTTDRPARPNTSTTTVTNDSRTSLRGSRGTDCGDPKKRLSQFRWKSQGLSSWPDGVDGRFICQNDSFYEVTRTGLRNYGCQSNYSNCVANPAKNIAVTEVSQDGMIWVLANGDQITLISK